MVGCICQNRYVLGVVGVGNNVRRTKRVGYCWGSKDELISDILPSTPSIGRAMQDDLLEPIYNSSVLIQDIALKTSWEQWTIETGSKRGSGRSLLTSWHDDDRWDRVSLVALFIRPLTTSKQTKKYSKLLFWHLLVVRHGWCNGLHTWIGNIYEWVRVSLSALFSRSCAISKQNA